MLLVLTLAVAGSLSERRGPVEMEPNRNKHGTRPLAFGDGVYGSINILRLRRVLGNPEGIATQT